jgi:hypothetical protein
VSEHRSSAPVSAITEELVASLGEIAGLTIPPERLAAVTARLQEMHNLAAALDAIDHVDAAPANRFDPAWPEGNDR